MTSFVFPPAIVPADGVKRTSKSIKKILADQENQFKCKQDGIKSINSNIKRKENEIKRYEKIGTYGASIRIRQKLKPDLKLEHERLAKRPGEINEIEHNILLLKAELEEAEAREAAVEHARKTRPANLPAPVANMENKAATKQPIYSIWNRPNGAKKPVIRREVLKLPVSPASKMNGFPFAPARNSQRRESSLGSSQTTPPRNGFVLSKKRKASDNLDKQAPVRCRKLQNGKALREPSADRDLASPPSASSRTGSVDQANESEHLAGTKESEALEDSAMAPTCPAIGSGRKKRPAPDANGDNQAPAGKRTKRLRNGIDGDGGAALSTSSSSRGKKREAPVEDDDDEELAAKRRRSYLEEDNGDDIGAFSSIYSSDKKKSRRLELNGTINHSNSCFSGVIIQLLDAALDGHDIDALSCKKFDKTEHIGELDPCLIKKQEALRAAIKAAAKAGETEKVSAVKHLRTLLHDLHTYHHGAADKNVSPYLFQSVMAWGAAEDGDQADKDLSDRQRMSGDTQEDCFEYYQRVLDTLLQGPHAGDHEALKKLFEIETETRDVCSSKECGYESTARTATDNYWNIEVPETKSGEVPILGGLINASKKSRKQDQCPKCTTGTLTAITEFTKVPESWVLKMNRTKFDAATEQTSKVETFVNLEPNEPLLHSASKSKYELSAVIRHCGQSTRFGHYTIFRKHNNAWYLLDDKQCSKKNVSDVRDSARGGHSAMLLFKKMDS